VSGVSVHRTYHVKRSFISESDRWVSDGPVLTEPRSSVLAAFALLLLQKQALCITSMVCHWTKSGVPSPLHPKHALW
jgi:hypothetical protein